MDDFWALIWGAVIALFASITGGVLTSLAGPALARKADAKERLRVSEAERREVVRQAIQDASLAMRRATMAWISDREAARKTLSEDIDVISITLRLRTTQEEEAIERTLGNASIEATHKALVVHTVAWERVAASWFRGAVSNEGFDDALDAERARLTVKAAEIIAERPKPAPTSEIKNHPAPQPDAS